MKVYFFYKIINRLYIMTSIVDKLMNNFHDSPQNIISNKEKSIQYNENFVDNIASFIHRGDLLNLILAVYLGNVLSKFFNTIVNGAIMPIISYFFPHKNVKEFADIVVDIHGIKIKLGAIIVHTISLVMGFLVAYLFTYYFIFRYLKK